jgi:hypothetical protein
LNDSLALSSISLFSQTLGITLNLMLVIFLGECENVLITEKVDCLILAVFNLKRA